MKDAQEKKPLRTMRKNTIMGFILGGMICGYLFFFLSSAFLPVTGRLNYTVLGQEIAFGEDRTFIINRWDYSPSQKLMEVEIEVTNNAFDGKDIYNYAARQRIKSISSLQTKTVIEESNFIVLQLLGVADNFTEISLWWSPAELDDYGIAKIYTNRNDVNRVDSITEKTKKEYYLSRLKRNMDTHQNKITELNGQIDENQNRILEIERQNEQLDTNKIYQTDQEIAVTNARIDANEKRIKELQEANANLRTEINTNKDLIMQIQIKIDELEETGDGTG